MTTNKTGQSNKNQKSKFLICAWNELKETDGDNNSTNSQLAGWKSDPLAVAVERMLKSRGLEAVGSEIDADLIVLVPWYSDLPYQIADAHIFHRMLRGPLKHVLLIDRLGTLSVPSEIWPKWFYCLKDASFDSSEFTKWITLDRLTQRVRSFRSSQYRSLGCKLLAADKHQFSTLLIKAESYNKLSGSGTCLLFFTAHRN